MEVNTRALIDTTAAQQIDDGVCEMGDKRVPFSQEHGDGEKCGVHKSDIDQSDSDTEMDIDEKLLDEFVGQSLIKVIQDLETGARIRMENLADIPSDATAENEAEKKAETFPELVEDSKIQRENVDNENVIPPRPSPIDENLLDDLVHRLLTKVVRDLEIGSNDGHTRVGTDNSANIASDPMPVVNTGGKGAALPMMAYPTDDIGEFAKANMDNDNMESIIRSELKPENHVSTPKHEPVVLDREYATQKPKRHATTGTLNKILMRLGLRKKPRYRLQKSDISWPLPGSLIIRGPDGELEDGLIAMYVSDLLGHIVSTQSEFADVVKRSTSPCLDKTAVKQTKSEGDISAHGASLPSTKKSRKFIRRLLLGCGWSMKSLRNNNNADLDDLVSVA